MLQWSTKSFIKQTELEDLVSTKYSFDLDVINLEKYASENIMKMKKAVQQGLDQNSVKNMKRKSHCFLILKRQIVI